MHVCIYKYASVLRALCAQCTWKSPTFHPKEPNIPFKRALHSIQKSSTFHPRELNTSSFTLKRAIQKNPIFHPKEPNIPIKRALHSIQRSPTFHAKASRILCKRAQHSIQKSPTFHPKEPYIPSKRALHSIQKSLAFHPKELFISPYTLSHPIVAAALRALCTHCNTQQHTATTQYSTCSRLAIAVVPRGLRTHCNTLYHGATTQCNATLQHRLTPVYCSRANLSRKKVYCVAVCVAVYDAEFREVKRADCCIRASRSAHTLQHAVTQCNSTLQHHSATHSHIWLLHLCLEVFAHTATHGNNTLQHTPKPDCCSRASRSLRTAHSCLNSSLAFLVWALAVFSCASSTWIAAFCSAICVYDSWVTSHDSNPLTPWWQPLAPNDQAPYPNQKNPILSLHLLRIVYIQIWGGYD